VCSPRRRYAAVVWLLSLHASFWRNVISDEQIVASGMSAHTCICKSLQQFLLIDITLPNNMSVVELTCSAGPSLTRNGLLQAEKPFARHHLRHHMVHSSAGASGHLRPQDWRLFTMWT
jgi:hypothetical protein